MLARLWNGGFRVSDGIRRQSHNHNAAAEGTICASSLISLRKSLTDRIDFANFTLLIQVLPPLLYGIITNRLNRLKLWFHIVVVQMINDVSDDIRIRCHQWIYSFSCKYRTSVCVLRLCAISESRDDLLSMDWKYLYAFILYCIILFFDLLIRCPIDKNNFKI